MSNVINSLFAGDLRIGTRGDGTAGTFDGQISCLQIFDTALDEATVHYESKCRTAESSLKKPNPCLGNDLFYDGQCFSISLSSDPFSKAEMKCLPAEDSLYHQQLMWTTNPKVWHRISQEVKMSRGSSVIHAGVSDIDNDGIYVTR